MSISTADFNAMLLDPHYDEIGVAARIITRAGKALDVTVIDHTAGKTINEAGAFQTETIRPVVCVRKAELADAALSVADVVDGQVVLDRSTSAEKIWRIKVPRDDRGELVLELLDEGQQ